MRLLEFAARAAVCWLSLTAIFGLAWCVCVTRYKSRQRAEITRRASYPPPVPRPTTPPLTQTLPDPSWFDGIPADCLSNDAVRSVFDHLVVVSGLEEIDQ